MNVIEQVKRFFFNEKGPPPEPDLTCELRVHHPVKSLVSTDHTCRVVIARTPENTFTFRAFVWDTSDWKVASCAFWNDVTPGNTFTDSAENAEQIARETMSQFELEEQRDPNKGLEDTSQ